MNTTGIIFKNEIKHSTNTVWETNYEIPFVTLEHIDIIEIRKPLQKNTKEQDEKERFMSETPIKKYVTYFGIKIIIFDINEEFIVRGVINNKFIQTTTDYSAAMLFYNKKDAQTYIKKIDKYWAQDIKVKNKLEKDQKAFYELQDFVANEGFEAILHAATKTFKIHEYDPSNVNIPLLWDKGKRKINGYTNECIIKT